MKKLLTIFKKLNSFTNNELTAKEEAEQILKFLLLKNSTAKSIEVFEALEIALNNQIDVVLMDINMPVMDGFEAVRQIRSFNKAVPIIAQTAYYNESDQPLSIFNGFSDFLSKPVDRNLLLEKVLKLIE